MKLCRTRNQNVVLRLLFLDDTLLLGSSSLGASDPSHYGYEVSALSNLEYNFMKFHDTS